MVSPDVFKFHLFPLLDWKTKANLRAVSPFICQLVDQSKISLFLRAPSSHGESDENILSSLLQKYRHIRTCGFSGFTAAHEKALADLSFELQASSFQNLTSLNFSNMHLENVQTVFLQRISSQNILEITYVQTNGLVKKDTVSKELATLFNTNQNLETLNLEITCHQDAPFIPFSFCKNLKELIHNGSDEVKAETLESLAQCEKLEKVSFKKENSKTALNLKKFFTKEIAKKITHLEIALKGKSPTPPCCLNHHKLSNLQFLNIHQYALSDSELLKIADTSIHLKIIILDVRLISENAFAEFTLKLPHLEKLSLECKREASYFLQHAAKCAWLFALKLKGGFFTVLSLTDFVQDHKDLKYLNIKNIQTNFNEKEYAIFLSSCNLLNFLCVEKMSVKEDKKKKSYSFSRPDPFPKKAFHTSYQK
ncbi:MAG TPA: hypothetical protein PLC42_05950 [Parachlamydiaceae bacterium]|nr:hypothetical protein [Parachlamydiaceae bacterium]